MIRHFQAARSLMALVILLAVPARLAAEAPYQPQAPSAKLGQVDLALSGPASFVRIDGLDRHLDDILLATQSPAAAVLALYAEPKAWAAFQAGSRKAAGDRPGLHCHAVVSTPAALAAQVISPAEFLKIKQDLIRNLTGAVKKERDLGGELSGVSDHQVERARGRVESFAVLADTPEYLTYRMESVLEMKLKGQAQPTVSRTMTVSTTLLLAGKIVNLQVAADPEGPPAAELEKMAQAWRDDFFRKNAHLKK